jgi:hypothetical protein
MDATEQREQMAKARQLRQADLRWLAGSDSGRRILSAFFHSQRSKSFSCDPNVTAYNLGRVDFARELLDDLRDADPALYLKAESFSFQG